jgi:4,5:9,10-diseco-3-hydroxy-5,9,17-trioxoandrosta-1(10),2-diene-4-oate hydrolase
VVLATLTENTATVSGLRLRYWDVGTGPAVVLVHGAAASVEYWRYTVGALAESHRVLALDLPGCGLSERGPALPTLPEAGDLLAAFLDALGIARAALVGHSLGGLVALEATLRHPGRAERLVLSNSAGLGPEISPLWRLAAIPPVGRLVFAVNRWTALRGRTNLFYHPRCEPEVAAHYRRWIARPDLAGTLVEIARSGVSLGGQRAEVLRVDRLAEVATPTLIVWGARDPVFPLAHGERAARLIPHARLAVLARCGHCPQLEAPDEFNRLAMEFMSEAADA